MANLMIVCGHHAVGKMTVAECLNLEPDAVADQIISIFHLSPNDKEELEYRYGI